MKKSKVAFGLAFGFVMGFLVAIIALTLLHSEISYKQSLYRQCNRTEFVLGIHERSIATIVMSC